MRPDIDTPLEPPSSIIHDARAQMTPRLQCISCLCTRGSSARALALGDRVRSMVHVCDWGKRVTACCGYFWWERDIETG